MTSTIPISAAALLDDLTLRNRCYQLLYLLGDDPSTVRTLLPGEAAMWVGIAREVEAGDRSTDVHRRVAEAVAGRGRSGQAILRYVATGRMPRAAELAGEPSSSQPGGQP
jgi:hypothetical protein